MALDKVPAAMMSGLLVSETAPSNPGIGQRWYKASTAVTYQYTNDGTSSFWLDVSSGGIGTSAERGIDFVGDVDPHKSTNGTGLAVGSVYYNRENNRHFVCTDATSNANVWSGRFTATGGIITNVSGYKYHVFLTSSVFSVEETISSIDVLVVGGGGGGGYRIGGGGAGSGVLIGAISNLPAGEYAIQVGAGGMGTVLERVPQDVECGRPSFFAGSGNYNLEVKGGGAGFTDQQHPPNPYTEMCSNIGGANANGSPNQRITYATNGTTHTIGSSATGTLHGVNLGGKAHTHNGGHSAGGGAGAGEAGNGGQGNATGDLGANAGLGGDGYQVSWATPDTLGYTFGSGSHNSVAYNTGFYFGGGGAGAQYSGGARNGGLGGGAGGVSNATATDAAGGTGGINNGGTADSTANTSSNTNGAAAGANTGGGGGGGAHSTGRGGAGGSGIVVIRYAL